MRKRKLGKTKKLKFSSLVIVFVIATLFFSVGYSLLVQDLTIGGTANLGNSSTGDDISSDDLKFTYNRGTWYSNGYYYYQFDMELENISTNDISDWKVIIDVPDDSSLVNSWNYDTEVVDGKLIISNGFIRIGEKITFGCQIMSSVENFDVGTVILNGTKIKVDPIIPDDPIENGLSVILKTTNSWQSNGTYYYQYDITFKNDGDTNINSWRFKLILPEGANMDSVWNANFIKADNIITLSNVGYNGSIAAGSSITFGGIFSSTNSVINMSTSDITGE